VIDSKALEGKQFFIYLVLNEGSRPTGGKTFLNETVRICVQESIIK